MRVYDFDKEVNRVNTGCVKWDRSFDCEAEEVFPLWVADMDFPCSDAIIEALHKRVDEQIFGYSMDLIDLIVWRYVTGSNSAFNGKSIQQVSIMQMV